MVRDIIDIDEELCVGCGNCVPNCHQGALQVIDGKVRLLSDLMCEGLGACVGHCPTGAMTVSRREAAPYDEALVMDTMIKGGPNVVAAHLAHLRQHRQDAFLAQALAILAAKGLSHLDPLRGGQDADHNEAAPDATPSAEASASGPAGLRPVLAGTAVPAEAAVPPEHQLRSTAPDVPGHAPQAAAPAGAIAVPGTAIPLQGLRMAGGQPGALGHGHHGHSRGHGGGGCPGSMARSLGPRPGAAQDSTSPSPASQGGAGRAGDSVPSELRQWPVQLHLLSPMAPYLQGADLLLAADCTAYAAGNFHGTFLRGKSLAIACPKLDDGHDSYIDKLAAMIDQAGINTLTVLIMEVPCCRGLVQIAQAAAARASRKVPIKMTIMGLEGDIRSETWL